MKKILFAAFAALSFSAYAQSEAPTFTVVKENRITSIKDQHRSGTCWSYSGLGFFEAELLRMGKGEFDLCESFVVEHTYMDRADRAVRTHGDVSFSNGGSFYDVLYALKKYGIVPEGTMPFPGSLYGDSLFNFQELDPIMNGYVKSIAKSEAKKIPLTWKKEFAFILENYFGAYPKEFEYEGKTYTPESFRDMLGLNLDDYVSLTSYTHEPFYDKFILEIQDNWRWASSYNLPLDEFMEVMESAVKNGYTFAWGADVSENGFSREGIAVCPDLKKAKDTDGSDYVRWFGNTGGINNRAAYTARPWPEITVTQEMRQEAYDNWETTDDHGMLIYGIAKDQNGKEYFMVKNSWGTDYKYNGVWYASKAFVAYKTMNILIHKDAIPKTIAKKLGIK